MPEEDAIKAGMFRDKHGAVGVYSMPMAKPPQSVVTALSSFKSFQEQMKLPETQKHLAQMATLGGSMAATVQSIQQATKPNILSSVNSLSAVIESMIKNEKK